MTYSFGGRIRRLAAAGAAVAAASLVLAGGALAEPPSNAGTFVIGDQNVELGSQVTFWGAQWWKDNPLSTGLGAGLVQRVRGRRDGHLRAGLDDRSR